MTTETKTIDWHGVNLTVDCDFYSDDLSVDIRCLTVIVYGVEVDEITAYVNKDGMEEIEETLVAMFLGEQRCTAYEIKAALVLRRMRRGT